MVLSLCLSVQMTKTFGLSQPSRNAEWEKMKRTGSSNESSRLFVLQDQVVGIHVVRLPGGLARAFASGRPVACSSCRWRNSRCASSRRCDSLADNGCTRVSSRVSTLVQLGVYSSSNIWAYSPGSSPAVVVAAILRDFVDEESDSTLMPWRRAACSFSKWALTLRESGSAARPTRSRRPPLRPRSTTPLVKLMVLSRALMSATTKPLYCSSSPNFV